ncbi:MAG: hypothetical protein M3Y08_04025 [Fibrobacterota bacterium]|nr:hypothetical protein [Fibrobacterota bacterium]
MKNTIRNRFTLLAAMSAGLIWSGCNGSDDPASPPTGNTHAALLDACGLLTSAEAAVILGKPILEVKTDTVNYVTWCSYVGSVNPGFLLPSHVDLTVLTTAGMQTGQPGSSLTVPTYFAAIKNALPAMDQVQLTGIGTDAIWKKKPGELAFYKGDVNVDIRYSPNGKLVDTSTASLEGCKSAALSAAGRI